jgi:2-polyprenyl-3-methyl-5-hydroxy-6-metoxy-1,4-benzoquinol methylase
MINISDYSDSLIQKEGIWHAKTNSQISYPEEGNSVCYQIEEHSFWFKHRNKCILTAVKKYHPEDMFFDIGGGNGFVAKNLEANQIPTVLIEPGFTGCKNANKRGLQHIVCSTLEDANFNKESLPAVGLFDVVEHIEKDQEFLNLIHSYLKPNGKVFITVPAFQFLWSNEDADAGHYRRYSIAQMAQKLQKAGFKINYATYIFSILPLAVFLFRSLPSRLGLNKNSNDISKHKNEHQEKPGMLSALLNRIWDYEINQILAGKSLPLGGSCFIVAEKI